MMGRSEPFLVAALQLRIRCLRAPGRGRSDTLRYARRVSRLPSLPYVVVDTNRLRFPEVVEWLLVEFDRTGQRIMLPWTSPRGPLTDRHRLVIAFSTSSTVIRSSRARLNAASTAPRTVSGTAFSASAAAHTMASTST
jgi:hypothetical protein